MSLSSLTVNVPSLMQQGEIISRRERESEKGRQTEREGQKETETDRERLCYAVSCSFLSNDAANKTLSDKSLLSQLDYII